jgi:Tol biopolymer transport system component
MPRKAYRTLTLLILLLASILTACGTLEVGIERTATPNQAATATVAALATEKADLAAQVATLEAGTDAVSSVATPIPGLSVSEAIAPLPGLVYQKAGELWRVDADGQPGQIFSPSGDQALYLRPLISPDGDQVLYWDWETNDVWLADLTTGLRRNLTNTPKDNENCLRWWPGRPDTVVFSSQPRELGPAPGEGTGFLGVVGTDGGGYRILDDQNNTYGVPAPSPDGQTIAYGAGSTAWLYHWETGPEVFNPADYGLTGSESMAIVSPAWSPDGTKLAWVADGGGLSPDGSIGIGVFDLQTRTARLLHPYKPPGMDGWPPRPLWSEGWPPAPLWSPDGRWLAFFTLAQDPREMGLWVLRADGQGEQEIPLSTGRNDGLAWSPDGRWLIFTHTAEESLTWIAEVGTWSRRQVDLPSDAVVVDWLAGNP